MTPHNRGMVLSVFAFLFSFQVCAQPTPVYLQPNNPAATGHFSQEELKKKALTYETYEWLWLRDSFGHEGWALKSSVMLPLDFSRQAVATKGEAIYQQPKSYIHPVNRLDNSQAVALITRQGDWFKVRYEQNKVVKEGWIPERRLQPYSKDPGIFYSTKESHLRQHPRMKSKILTAVEPGIPLFPKKLLGDWALVSMGKKEGYIPLTNLKSRLDVAMKVRTTLGYVEPQPQLIKEKILEIFANPLWIGTGAYTLELKSQPNMGSNTVTTVSPWQTLTLQGYSIKRWGKSRIYKWGDLWWPDKTIESNTEFLETLQPRTIQLSKNEVMQVEPSPKIPGLVFASTLRGVFRSFDGKTWMPLPGFKHGYPIKITSNGTLFIGDKVSFDHGESFNEYIRWDKILGAIPIERRLGHAPIQILNVEPNEKRPERISLSVKFGQKRVVQVYTPDFGRSWRLQ